MTDTSSSSPRLYRGQLRLLAIVLMPILAVLITAYFLFVRHDYAILARDLRPAEAGAIVAELKKLEVSYELRQQGSTILVPENQADDLRLSIVSGGIAEPGSVGFELFNESDMGLTDFAQKVNYQRALQGELARTIMGMEGIAYARVHLALPERSLFRANRSEPSAAVTVVPKPSILFDAARIAGIQRLVASTVTDLKVENVAVLNQRGQLMTPDPELVAPDRMANASSLEKAYAERVGQAVGTFAPDLSFDVKVTTIAVPVGAEPMADARTGGRDHAIRVVMFTAAPVPADRQAVLSRIIARAVGADREAGDDIQFSLFPQITNPMFDQTPVVAGTAPRAADDNSVNLLGGRWIEAAALAAASLIAVLFVILTQRRRAGRRERLYIRIREQLRIEHAGA